MKRIKTILALACLVILNPAQSQTIGSKLPSFTGLPVAHDRLLILDFFTTTCANCIAAVPRLNALQKRYRGKLDIVMISPEPVGLVSSFFKKNSFTKKNHLPVIMADTLLSSHFPHILVPHEVWVYHDTIRAITEGDFVQERYIDSVLNGASPHLTLKNDFITFDFTKPLYEAAFSNNYSIVLPYQHAAYRSYGLDTLTLRNAFRYYALNVPITGAYLQALGKLRKLPYIKPSRIITEGVNRDQFVQPTKMPGTLWSEQYDICYEFVIPDSICEQNRVQRLVKDLNLKLGMNVRLEKRSIPCLVVRESRTPVKLEALRKNGWKEERLKVYLFMQDLETQDGPPILNETGKDRIIFFPPNKDAPVLKDLCVANGLELLLEKQEIEVLVISPL